MINTTFLKRLIFILVLIILSSCDKDYNSIGSDLVGSENFLLQSQDFTVKAYNQKINAVETNNLPTNVLGIINSTIFGKTRANFVTQLEIDPRSLGRVFGANTAIDSVVLSIPYFARQTGVLPNGTGTYNLESTYTDNANPAIYEPINLKVYENGFYLRDFDPNTSNNETSQIYYSDENAMFDAAKLLELSSQPTFVADKREIILYRPDSTINKSVIPYIREYTTPNDITKISRRTPSLRMKLDESIFLSKVINTTPSNLSSNNIFKNHLKGLYFKVEDVTNGSLYNLDFTKGKVTIYYKEDLLTTLEGQSFNSRPRKTFIMNMTGNSASLLDNVDNATYASAVNSPNLAAGDGLLYLKGGQGSQAFIELFSASELADLQSNKWLINQANITFTIDENYSANNNKKEPLRLYLYNADNNVPIIDYSFDASSDPLNPKLNKQMFGGIIQIGANGKGTKYVINITEHVNAIINSRATNVRLGLAITDDIRLIGNSSLKTIITTPRLFDKTPKASVMSPLGTVVYGSNTGSGLDNKKVNFKIYYTKPN